MLLMARLQTEPVMADGGSLTDGYNSIVTSVGSQATLAKISKEALQVVYDQAVAEKDRVSGVSLDEEAADLIRYQQAFQASAKIIEVSSKLFDSIIAMR
jgi:flagellar hook-associated protein FlgK